jgi:hypothetical protein
VLGVVAAATGHRHAAKAWTAIVVMAVEVGLAQRKRFVD